MVKCSAQSTPRPLTTSTTCVGPIAGGLRQDNPVVNNPHFFPACGLCDITCLIPHPQTQVCQTCRNSMQGTDQGVSKNATVDDKPFKSKSNH